MRIKNNGTMGYPMHVITTNTSYKRAEIKKYLYERVKELKEYSKDEFKTLVRDNELHNEIFNTDYYMVYTGECEEWLGDHVFEVIRTVQEYEEFHFGELTDKEVLTDPCKLVNMYVYIVGEELISEDPKLHDYS